MLYAFKYQCVTNLIQKQSYRGKIPQMNLPTHMILYTEI